MKKYPCAKINLGLNIVAKRADGYHDIETVFYPIPLYDELEVKTLNDDEYVGKSYVLATEGNSVDCPDDDNLVVKAYKMLAEKYPLPRVSIRLKKNIPSQAGLGGGSSDATAMLMILNEKYNLGISDNELRSYASKLGADCPFFVDAKPTFATGIGNIFEPLTSPISALEGRYIVVVKPDIAVSTREAYSMLRPRKPDICCKDIVHKPVEAWKGLLTNDFEQPVFGIYPELASIKQRLYCCGATYAQMSGSGSAIFGIFDDNPSEKLNELWQGKNDVFVMQL